MLNISRPCSFRPFHILKAFISNAASSSFDHGLIRTYKRLLNDYWEPYGRAQRFFEMNKLLVPQIYCAFIVPSTLNMESLEPRSELRQIKVLDIGCGGGITSESLAKLNFDVVGIDPNPDLIYIAQAHQEENKALIGKSLCYLNTTVEDFVKTHGQQFDAVLISEVLEYIPFWRKNQFVELCTSFCKNDGKVFITTINESAITLLRIFQIYSTEMFSGTVGINFLNGISSTHLSALLRTCGCSVRNIRGIDFDIVKRKFSFDEKNPTWLFAYALKRHNLLP